MTRYTFNTRSGLLLQLSALHMMWTHPFLGGVTTSSSLMAAARKHLHHRLLRINSTRKEKL